MKKTYNIYHLVFLLILIIHYFLSFILFDGVIFSQETDVLEAEVLFNRILGDIYFVQINCFWNRDKRYYKERLKNGNLSTWHGSKKLDGGTLFTQFSHFIDLMYWFFGDIIFIF